MADFFYELPIWLSTILVLGSALALGLASSTGIRALFRVRTTREETDIAINLMQVVAAYIGILLAFAAVEVWQDFADAQTAVHQEAATGSELYRDLATYGADAQAARGELRAYVASVVRDEWPLLREGHGSKSTDTALARLFQEFGKIRPHDDRDSAIYAEAFSKLNDLVVLRRNRLIDSQAGIPAVLWLVGFAGSILMISFTSAFAAGRYNLLMISGISLTLGLVFLFILTVDKPFKGQVSIDSSEMFQLPALFDQLDQIDTTGQAP
ncbi:MAG: DUF4239 domain-containing protein [Sphingomonas sp.]|nr:DUF4239 domain-containing protein [Sphingomonas sp.]